MTKRIDKINEIANNVLDIDTLEVQGMDDLDFHDLDVESIKKALIAAYEAGRTHTKFRHVR
jgi:translation initiation factor 2 alpha subunit (eIF-2alpha)